MAERGPGNRPSLKYQLAGSSSSTASTAAGPRVLVVDDDPDMTRLVAAALSTTGVVPIAAYDALQGMVVAQRESPSLIIVDLHMPAGGGFKLLEKLRNSARTVDIPVLVVTADADKDLPRRAEELGARGFLRKPVDLVRLVEDVTHILFPERAAGAEVPAK
jgi:CheY-like chemotaxis protein